VTSISRRRRGWLDPPVLHPVTWSRDLAGLTATILTLLVVDGASAPRTVQLEDDGLKHD